VPFAERFHRPHVGIGELELRIDTLGFQETDVDHGDERERRVRDKARNGDPRW